MPYAGPAIARHPYSFVLDATVQLAAAAVLLHEGVETSKQLGHVATRRAVLP